MLLGLWPLFLWRVKTLKRSFSLLTMRGRVLITITIGLHYLYLHSTLRTGGRSTPHKRLRRNMGSNASGQSDSTSPPHWTKHLLGGGGTGRTEKHGAECQEEAWDKTAKEIIVYMWKKYKHMYIFQVLIGSLMLYVNYNNANFNLSYSVGVWNLNLRCWTLNDVAKIKWTVRWEDQNIRQGGDKSTKKLREKDERRNTDGQI